MIFQLRTALNKPGVTLDRMRIGAETFTVPKFGAVLVGPEQLRQVFNDTEEKALWLIIGTPERTRTAARSKITGRPQSHQSGRPDTIAQGTGREHLAAADGTAEVLSPE